ncbi:MAG: hypothetical protein EPO40_02670 [Myxococcaceae bacterium]|nr:MAG: hypothetical protein EPO40_02670 [Myxococcaceae bacterium]
MTARCSSPLLSIALLSLVACAPTLVTPPTIAPTDAANVLDAFVPDASLLDASAAEAATDARAGDAPTIDEAPTRLAMCTNQLGRALDRSYGRLDGRLVAIVPAGQRDCNGDPDHLHLQIAVDGAIYDVAVNLGSRRAGGVPDLAVASVDVPLPDGAWVEGWHTMIAPLDYVTTLHLHSSDFAPLTPAEVSADLETELRDVGRISVFAIGYGPDGVHNVHRNQGLDGALALHPAGARAHLKLFRFASQSF